MEEDKNNFKLDESPPEETIPLSKNWRLVVTSIFAMMTLCTVAASAFYFHESGKNSQEEKKVAAGIADIAMAMAYTQINHIAPSKQNWSEPDFLNSNISKVVSPDLHPQAVINHQGQFNNYPYLLRVYTNGDLSQFLVIAQPAPHRFQWLIHKKAIAIDSKTMEIRKISDLKTLNRLLATQNPLAGNNGEEISRLVKEGTLMPLSSLSGKRNRWGFTPPKGLSSMRPGAENYIYNAPRYFPFSESITKSPSQTLLGQDLELLCQFPDLVLFSSTGVDTALESLKALKRIAPNSEFLTAYIRFNDDGIVINSHLINKEKIDEIAELDASNIPIDNRRAKLEQITQKIKVLLEENNGGHLPDFHNQIHALIEEYEAIDLKDELPL